MLVKIPSALMIHKHRSLPKLHNSSSDNASVGTNLEEVGTWNKQKINTNFITGNCYYWTSKQTK